MRFCLNCGSSLPDAPVIVNFGGSQGGGSNPGTNPYGQSMETQFGKPQQQQQFGQPPQFQPPPQQNYSMVPPSSKGGSGKKIFIAVAGVFALFFLIIVAIAGIVGYNMMKNNKQPVVSNSPTPSASPSGSVSPSASPSASKTSSPTPRPSETPNTTSDAKVKFDKVWVDYNVKEAGENGMRIHVKFQVSNLQGVDSKLIIFFQKADGTDLTGSGLYSTNDGRLAAKRELKPGYDVTEYKDLEVFMPYSELGLSKGKYNLKMDIDLTDDDETVIEHLGYHEFQYEKF